MLGFYRVAAATPKLRVADVGFNKKEIIELITRADENSAAVLVFPELCMTGYTCADLFHQSALLDHVLAAITEIVDFTREKDIVVIIGAPYLYRNSLFNCAFVIHKGAITGIVPKTYIPNYREFYEKRWFTSGAGLDTEVNLGGISGIPFGNNLIFEYDRFFKFAIELCEDLWAVVPPSSYHAVAGATVCFNLSASNELVAKSEYRRQLISQQSARCMCAYVYGSSSVHESTTDLVFGGHSLIAENGMIIAENARFQRSSSILYADIDCQRLVYLRFSEGTFTDFSSSELKPYRTVMTKRLNSISNVKREFDAHPFVPSDRKLRNQRCREIFNIQSSALAKRLEHVNAAKAVIGISGGLDSTLALLVTGEAFKLIGKKSREIITVTMPGFGTTDRTYNNAALLGKILQTEQREINIRDSCLQHFKDIEHDPEVHDLTYENVQARERTQVLMDIANKENGIVIGTGDLSEIALGWSTYNGDHMSMYAVNCSVPKTLIKYLIQWVADHSNEQLQALLNDIIDTPITPELLPNSKKNEISQRTEDLIGPYELHDFFLFHTVKYGATPEKIHYLAEKAFCEQYSPEKISKWLNIFVKRFFSQQFKRSCIPDGPKVGSISLSPRGDWRMPSDAESSTWLNHK